MNEFLQALRQAEYVHILLNPLPVYATACGMLGLIVGLILRSRAAQATALVIMLLGTLSVWPVEEYGEHGYAAVHKGTDAAGQKWLVEHAYRAGAVAWVFHATAAVTAAGLLALWKWPKIGTWLVLLALAAGSGCLVAGGWISQAGGKIRHTEFRHGPPPAREILPVEHD